MKYKYGVFLTLNKLIIVVSLFLLFHTASVLHAQSSSNFSISPPPIPWFEYEKGQNDIRISTAMFSIDSDENPYLEMTGIVGGLMYREAFSDIFALTIGASFFISGGDIAENSSVEMYGGAYQFGPELQIINTENLGLILFGSLYGNGLKMSGTTPTASIDVSIKSGICFQAGMQFSIKLGDFALSPFYLYQKTGSGEGSGQIKMKVGGTNTTSRIPSYVIKTYGFDIVYVPGNITLSSMLQLNPDSENTTNMYLLSISYDVRWGVDKN